MLVFFERNIERKLEAEAERIRGRLGNGLKSQNVLSIYSSNILQNLASFELC
jgi:hypothetical protein